jgi:NADH-quinone oxidoreductase subunit I
MLCARECPDWCLYVEGHTEAAAPVRPGGRPRVRNVLDRFAIDWSLCMYCGICVEVCPFDALFWAPALVPATEQRPSLVEERADLRAWVREVPAPPPWTRRRTGRGGRRSGPPGGRGGRPHPALGTGTSRPAGAFYRCTPRAAEGQCTRTATD